MKELRLRTEWHLHFRYVYACVGGCVCARARLYAIQMTLMKRIKQETMCFETFTILALVVVSHQSAFSPLIAHLKEIVNISWVERLLFNLLLYYQHFLLTVELFRAVFSSYKNTACQCDIKCLILIVWRNASQYAFVKYGGILSVITL